MSTNYVDIAADSDYVVHMVVVMHTKDGTSSDTDWVRTMQAEMVVVLVHPKPALILHQVSVNRLFLQELVCSAIFLFLPY